MALFIFIAVTIIGFIKHGFKYLTIFVPSGVPAVLALDYYYRNNLLFK